MHLNTTIIPFSISNVFGMNKAGDILYKLKNTSLIKKAISIDSIMQSSYVTMFVFHIHIELWLQNTLINVI